MASTLNSNSFLLTPKTTPPPNSSSRLLLTLPSTTLKSKSKLKLKSKKSTKWRVGVLAKDENENGNFRFDFGLIPAVSSPSRRKDPNTVFVAGATGQTGARIALTLLRQGFSVRAGVSDLRSAQDLARLAAQYKIISNAESKRLNAVESSFQDTDSMAKAMGSASKVVVTVGSGENGPTGVVSLVDALNVVQAAELAGVAHLAIVYDGNAPNASTGNVLDGLTSFFSNIFSRSQPMTVQQLLIKVVETNLRYTFIKTSLTDDFGPQTAYNLVLSPDGSAGATDYNKVGTSQIATVVAKVFSNTAAAENKVVQISTSPSAPSKSIEELLSSIPEDGRRAAYLEAREKAKEKEKEEELGKVAIAEEAEETKTKVKARVEEEVEEKVIESVLGRAGFSWDKLSAQLIAARKKKEDEQDEEEEESPKVRVATVRGIAKALSLPSFKAVVKPAAATSASAAYNNKKTITNKKKAAPPPKRGKPTPPPPAQNRNVFGGLFKQDTIYIEDD